MKNFDFLRPHLGQSSAGASERLPLPDCKYHESYLHCESETASQLPSSISARDSEFENCNCNNPQSALFNRNPEILQMEADLKERKNE